jgi:hypothetical protein
MHYTERSDSNLVSVTRTVDAMIKGGASKLQCTIIYKAYISLYRRELEEPVRLKEAVEFVNDRAEAFKDSDIASYEDLARLVTSYGDLTDKNEELIAEQSELIGNYEKLVAKQQGSLDSLGSQAQYLYRLASSFAKLADVETVAKVKGATSRMAS